MIGGNSTANIISGNAESGVFVEDPVVGPLLIMGNYIGESIVKIQETRRLSKGVVLI